MLTDYHCHILPGIDDGAKTPEIAKQMLAQQALQGVERVVFTPHFYRHREKSAAMFLEKREQAMQTLLRHPLPIKEYRLGAEIAIERDISELSDLPTLAITGTKLILLEFPYTGYAEWMVEELHNIACGHGLVPMIAHVHRYTAWYSKSEMENILSLDAVFQVNAEAFGSWKEKHFVQHLFNQNKQVVFGSDAHNLEKRRPNFDLLLKKVKAEQISRSDSLLEAYMT